MPIASSTRIFSFLFSISTWNLYYSQEARGYSIVLALSTGAAYFLLRAEATGRGRDWTGYVVCCIASIHAHIFAAFLPLGFLIASRCPPRKPDKETLKRHLAAFAAISLASLQVWSFLLPQIWNYLAQSGEGPGPAFEDLLRLFGAHLAPLPAQLLLVLAAGVGAILLWKTFPRLVLALLVSLGLPLLLSLFSPAFRTDRFLMFAFPLLFVCLCRGLIPVSNARIGGLAVSVAALIFSLSLVKYVQGSKLDFRRAAVVLEEKIRSDSRVGLWFDCRTMQRYARSPSRFEVLDADQFLETSPDWFCILDAGFQNARSISEELKLYYHLENELGSHGRWSIQIWKRGD